MCLFWARGGVAAILLLALYPTGFRESPALPLAPQLCEVSDNHHARARALALRRTDVGHCLRDERHVGAPRLCAGAREIRRRRTLAI